MNAREKAEKYVEETDYIDNLNRNLAGNAYLAGYAQAIKDAAEIARTFAQDHLTIQPSYTALAETIRKLKGE